MKPIARARTHEHIHTVIKISANQRARPLFDLPFFFERLSLENFRRALSLLSLERCLLCLSCIVFIPFSFYFLLIYRINYIDQYFGYQKSNLVFKFKNSSKQNLKTSITGSRSKEMLFCSFSTYMYQLISQINT